MSSDAFRPRDRSVIDFVLRYRMATNDVLATKLFTGRSLNAVTKVTARLCACDLLARYTLIPPQTYFRLGTHAVNVLGLPARHTEALGPQALPNDFATMIYATKGKDQRRRLTASELAEYMPWLPNELSRSPYCLDSHGRLDLVRVDLGGSPQHVARKVTSAAHLRLDVPELSDLAMRLRFQVVVLTTSDEKAKSIAKSLQACGCVESVRVHIAVIPRLSFLLLQLK